MRAYLLQHRSLLSAFFGVLLLAFWELSAAFFIDPVWVSSPSRIVVSMQDLITSGELWRHGRITLQEAIVGFVGGLISGSIVGMALGRNPYLSKICDPYIMVLYSLPRLALAPIFVLWFGIGPDMKYALVAMSTFFPIMMNSYVGSKDVDRDLLDVLRVMGATRRNVFAGLVVPSTLIWIFAACRLALPHSIGVALVGEMIVSTRGLGWLALRSASRFDTDTLFAVLFVAVIIGVALFKLLTYVEWRVMRWKATERKGFI